MIYLKDFSESFQTPSSFREEVQEFCENCLAYLIDDYFCIQTSLHSLDPVSVSFVLIRRFEGKIEPTLFNWNDVKDYYIPLLQLLKGKYNLINSSKEPSNITNSEVQVVIRTSEFRPSEAVYYTLYEVLEDKVNTYDKIYYIKILITEK